MGNSFESASLQMSGSAALGQDDVLFRQPELPTRRLDFSGLWWKLPLTALMLVALLPAVAVGAVAGLAAVVVLGAWKLLSPRRH
jgi:hypothetical protein